MVWLDRITGKKLKVLPAKIVSSRYITCDPFEINGHSILEADGLMVDDGSGRLLSEDGVSNFLDANLDQSIEVQRDVVKSALMEYQSAIDRGRNRSFLLPEKLLTLLHMQQLDLIIQEVLKKGHFHEIVRVPKMDLVYQEYLLPVGRVKKIPSSATRHLAAHSECWQKRSFSGVIPKSLLALESEDEFNVYENRVFTRLLDHLERYLLRRCKEVSLLDEIIAEREQLDGSGIYWELRNAICSLWGEGFSSNKDLQEEEIEGKGTLQVLRSMLKQIRGLQQSNLYKAIPRKDEIGSKIRMTNTLSHDQHYRHVARLWHQWSEYTNSGKIDPGIIFEQNTEYAKAYISYINELVFRALKELGYSDKDGKFVLTGRHSVEVSYQNFNLILTSGKSTMVIVSIFSPGLLDDIGVPEINEDNIVVITPESAGFSLTNSFQIASPLYFYTLEAMVSRLSFWLTLQVVEVMDEKLEKIPNKACVLIEDKYKSFFITGNHTAILRAPNLDVITQIRNDFSLIREDASINKFLSQLTGYSVYMNALLFCPICGEKSKGHNYSPRDEGCFDVRGGCGHVWKIDIDKKSNRFLKVEPDSDNKIQQSEKDAFLEYGRYKWEHELLTTI